MMDNRCTVRNWGSRSKELGPQPLGSTLRSQSLTLFFGETKVKLPPTLLRNEKDQFPMPIQSSPPWGDPLHSLLPPPFTEYLYLNSLSPNYMYIYFSTENITFLLLLPLWLQRGVWRRPWEGCWETTWAPGPPDWVSSTYPRRRRVAQPG